MAPIRNTPPVIWNMQPDSRHFDNIGVLINKIPVFKITREKSVMALPDHAIMIEKFLRNGRNLDDSKNP